MTNALKAADHPYHCADMGGGQEFDSWQDFLDEWGEADEDYNALVRWDWDAPEYGPREAITLHFLQQRKAIIFTVTVTVSDADEPQVRAYLEEKWAYIRKLWAPISGAE